MSRTRLFACAAALVAQLGCHTKPDAAPAPAASTLAPSSAAVTTSTRTFAIEPTSTTTIDLPGKDEHIKARTTAAKGMLTVEPHALSKSRGEVQVDLATLTTSTFPDEARNAEQTKHARTWLEAVVSDQVQEPNRWAVLAVRSLDVTGDEDLAKVPLVGELRTVQAVVHGDVLIHGHKVERAIPVTLAFSYAPGAAADAPSALRVTTTKPLDVVLKEHEVMPRDPVGKALQWTSELTHRVATDANVDVDLKATPAHG